MMAVLEFSCNSDVVMGGGEYSIDLFCHLDQKLLLHVIFN